MSTDVVYNPADADEVPEISMADVYYLASLYGIKSNYICFIKPLPSYDDRVFHIDIHPQHIDPKIGIIPLVMKCSICNSFSRVDMQIQVMKRLHDHGVPSPKPIPLRTANNPLRQPNDHRYIYRTTNSPLKNEKKSADAQKKVNVHCMSYIEGGILAADVDQTDVSFLQNLGESIGQLSVALQGLKHEASEFEFLWDLQYSLKAEPKVESIPEPDKQKLLRKYFENFKNILWPLIVGDRLRKSIIHGDLNDMNMLCNAQGNDKMIIGFLDFGDCKSSCTVFDVAICAAYFMLNKDKETALKVMYQILESYHRVNPLTNSEIEGFFVAVCSRIMVSALIGYEKILLHPENKEYLSVHSKPAWTFLEQFVDTDPIEMAAIIKRKLKIGRASKL